MFDPKQYMADLSKACTPDPRPCVEEIVAIWNGLRRNWGKVALAALVIFFGPPLYEEYRKRSAESDAIEASQRVGTDASIAGMMYASAYRSCRLIGILPVEQCATHKGILLQETSAQVLAQSAVQHREGFEKNCQKWNASEYCYQLLNRAFLLSLNSDR